MKTKITITLFGMILAFALGACATNTGSTSPTSAISPTSATGLQITDIWARTVNMGAMAEETPAAMEGTPNSMGMGTGDAAAQQMGAVYMNITNSGAADKLIKAETDVANTVELHNVVEEAGVMQMRPVPAIDVPANGSVQLKPGGFHVMLIGVNKELKPGDRITVRLTFENEGEKEIQAEIRAQ
jgi:copper(I)-binding protein